MIPIAASQAHSDSDMGKVLGVTVGRFEAGFAA